MAEQSPTARQNDRAQGGVPVNDPFDPAALRARLEEARAQRERAIAARHGAVTEAPANAPGPRPVSPPPPHPLPRQPSAEPSRPRFEAQPSRIAAVPKSRPAPPEPLVALPGERPAPPRRTPKAARRMLPALAFLGGCLAVAAGVSLAPPSLRQQIAEFIAPSQPAPAPVADAVAEPDAAIDAGAVSGGAPVTAQIVGPAETPDAPPSITVATVENPAPPVAARAPGSILALQTSDKAPLAPAAPAYAPDLPPDSGPPPRMAVALADDLPAPRVPEALPAPEVRIAFAGRPVEPLATPPVGPAPERLPTVAPLPTPVAATPVQEDSQPIEPQAEGTETETPPLLAETPPAPPTVFQEPTLALGEAAPPPAGPPLRAATPPRRPAVDAPSPETLAALVPTRPAESEVIAPAPPGPARVLVHYPPSAVAAAQAAAAALAGSGTGQAEVVPVQFTISRTNVRYYHPQDAGTAQALATALSGADASLSAEIRDFTDFRPRPAPGTIEIWLAGDGPEPTRTAARTPQPAVSAPRPAAPRASPQAVATDERQRLEREIQGLLLRQLQELQRR